MSAGSTGRMLVALGLLGGMALLVWRTMDPGKLQQVTWLALGFFGLRVLLLWFSSRRMRNGTARENEDRT